MNVQSVGRQARDESWSVNSRLYCSVRGKCISTTDRTGIYYLWFAVGDGVIEINKQLFVICMIFICTVFMVHYTVFLQLNHSNSWIRIYSIRERKAPVEKLVEYQINCV